MKISDFLSKHADRVVEILFDRLDEAQKQLIVDTVEKIQKTHPKCDMYTINYSGDKYQQIRFGIKNRKAQKGNPVLYIARAKGSLWLWENEKFIDRQGDIELTETNDDIERWLKNSQSRLAEFMSGNNYSPNEYEHIEKGFSPVNNINDSTDPDNILPPLNQIFYGPPGTGKTYHTIEAAIQAAEPAYYSELKRQYSGQESTEFRTALTVKYKEFVAANRIRFVTFHQSYGYEEFVEGISAKD